MTPFKIRLSCIAVVVGVLSAWPLAASQGHGNGGGGSTPPTLPPAPVTVVNPVAVDCYSGPGCLDPAFGSLGKTQQDIGGAIQNMEAIAIQSDGRIVAAGTRSPVSTSPNDMSCVIGRFLPDGSADSTFGAGGLATVNLIAGDSIEWLIGVAVQADGKVVVAASSSVSGSSPSTVLLRLTAAGALDPTFGSGGKVTLSSSISAIWGGVVLQPDGKIVVAVQDIAGFTRVTRLLTDGSPDKKFGTQGSRAVADLVPMGVALQSTGKIVVAGQQASGPDAVVTRFTSSGSVDTTFGNGGSTIVDFSGQKDVFMDVSVGPDDSIAAAGYANATGTLATMNAAIAHFTANGSLDNSFGSHGRVVLDIHGGWDHLRAVNLRADGRVEFAGWAGHSTTTPFPANLIVGRLTATGALDASFGSGGVTETVTGISSEALAMAVGPDGLLTVAGQVFNVTTNAPDRWLLARYFR